MSLRQVWLLIKVYCSLTNGMPNYSLDGKPSRRISLLAYQISPLAHLPASWLSWVHPEVASHHSSVRGSRSPSKRQVGMFVSLRLVWFHQKRWKCNWSWIKIERGLIGYLSLWINLKRRLHHAVVNPSALSLSINY